MGEARRTVVCVSVDLDEIGCYRSIHGLGEAEGEAAWPIHDFAVPRFGELFARTGVRATFFVVGREAARRETRSRLRDLAAAGHELASHSLSHLYDLTRRTPAIMTAEVAGGRAAIEDALGGKVLGFRAPGYTLTRELVEVLQDQQVGYDSSVLPSPPYLVARSAAIVVKAMRGRKSRSVFGGLEMGVAPRKPYLLGSPWFRRASEGVAGVRELPIAVVPGIRLPYIGTTLVLAGPMRALWLTRLVERCDFVNLELHGIDLCGPDDPGIRDLAGHQPDASVPLFEKTSVLENVLNRFRTAGAEFLTLAEAADRFLPTG